LPISVFKSRSQYKAIANSELSPDVKELILQQISSTDMEEDSDAELAEEDVDRIPEDASSTELQNTPSRKEKPTERKKKASSTLETGDNTQREKELLDVEQVINQRYVNLVDIFPPVPEKGKFNIETIKDSLYFFS
jgi:DNA-directed RNA polymerase, mitochondrial